MSVRLRTGCSHTLSVTLRLLPTLTISFDLERATNSNGSATI